MAMWGTMRFSGTFRNIPDKTLDQGSEAFSLILSFPESREAPKEKMLHKTAREKSDWRQSDLTLLFCYISHFVVSTAPPVKLTRSKTTFEYQHSSISDGYSVEDTK